MYKSVSEMSEIEQRELVLNGMQKYINVPKRKPISKQMAKAIRKAENEIMIEGDRQIDIQICAASIALWRYWGWKKEKLSNLIRMEQSIWNEVGQNNDISMLQLLDDECDIELTNREGVSYKEYKFLNTAIDDGHDLSAPEWIIMRQKQKTWIECQIMACVFLGMYRKEGWSPKRIKELMDRMQQIKSEFDYDPKKLADALLEECDYDWLEQRGKIENG